MESDEFTRNGYGVRIRKCCASCRHKAIDSRLRLCMKGEGHVSPTSVCEMWECNPPLMSAGKGDGMIKDPMYLRYCIDRKFPDGGEAENVSVMVLRQEFMEKFGRRIYL